MLYFNKTYHKHVDKDPGNIWAYDWIKFIGMGTMHRGDKTDTVFLIETEEGEGLLHKEDWQSIEEFYKPKKVRSL